jgi:hypothetical protein
MAAQFIPLVLALLLGALAAAGLASWLVLKLRHGELHPLAARPFDPATVTAVADEPSPLVPE